METTRKAWSSPQVFVLGVENTLSGQIAGGIEGQEQAGYFEYDHDDDPTTPDIKIEITLTYST
jgi:hypothetical protein